MSTLLKIGWKAWLTIAGALIVLGVIVWQATAAHGVPDPSAKNLSPAAIVMGSAVLVFREGLEAILVLAAITAGVVRNRHAFWRSILLGVAAALLATVVTWFIVVAVLSSISAPALAIQAGTGLLAIVVLLVIMNWFFHKIYWTGWIAHHSKRKQRILKDIAESPSKVALGLALLGFTCIYREGFEIVLFLQDLRLKGGSGIVFMGAGIGVLLTSIVAVLTFVAHERLPYKKMLVLTGVMLAGVLVVMVGESAQEMQQAGWLSTTSVNLAIPDWVGTWFAIFPNAQGLIAQGFAILLVGGSYVWIRRQVPRESKLQAQAVIEVEGIPETSPNPKSLSHNPGR